MKRQVAILGPTPEFLRWSVRKACSLRCDTDLSSVDQTEKRLRAIRVASLAIEQGRVFRGIAVDRLPTEPSEEDDAPAIQGFSLQEIFDLWGGRDAVMNECSQCEANLLQAPEHFGRMAGCHGWLRRESATQEFWEQFEDVANANWTQYRGQRFLETSPRWYGLWVPSTLEQPEIHWLEHCFSEVWRQMAPPATDTYAELLGFHRVLAGCLQHGLLLDVEAMPRGHSDGLFWTLEPFCDRCRATRSNHSRNVCPVCGKPGGGHPVIKRKVRGLRPFVDLAIVLGKQQVPEFIEGLRRQNR